MNAADAERDSWLARLRLLALDIDGVLTDGMLYIGAEGELMKAFCARDGHGLKAVMAAGVSVGWISARDSRIARCRAEELGVDQAMVRLGCKDKLREMKALCDAVGCSLSEAAYMGDDIPDLPVFAEVGMSLAPANAAAEALEKAHWHSRCAGGAGAVREICDLILRARDKMRS